MEAFKKEDIEEVVCGGAKGADLLGAMWANANNIPVKTFLAEWDKYGRSAGMIRNRQMAEYGDFLIAFWDGQSPGTKNMINEMKYRNKHGKVYIKE